VLLGLPVHHPHHPNHQLGRGRGGVSIIGNRVDSWSSYFLYWSSESGHCTSLSR
jgi:hypothetical protein